MTHPRIEADLDLRIEPPGDAPPILGRLTAEGGDLVLTTRQPQRLVQELRLAGANDVGGVRRLAAALADRGVTLRVDGTRGPILRLGVGAGSPFGRLLTRSPDVGLGSAAAIAPLTPGVAGDALQTRWGRAAAAVALVGAVLIMLRARRSHRMSSSS